VTPPEIVASLVWIAYLRGEIEGKRVVELGCGTGPFCLATAILNGYCICVEIDDESIYEGKRYATKYSSNVDYIQADVRNLTIRADVVFQNPPFGVVNRGIDLIFLKKAMEIGKTIYSIHKSNEESRRIIIELARERGFKVELLTTNYRLKAYYPWHKKKFHEFLVDIYLFSK